MTEEDEISADRLRRVVAGVVPCYNAGARVRPGVERLTRLLEQVIVVDDGSTDGAVEALRDLPVHILTFPKNRGKGHALLAGFRQALTAPNLEAVCVLDADGQHNPEEIPRLFEVFLRESADLVIGSRTFDERLVPWRSRFGNRVTVAITDWLLGWRLEDTQCGFRLLSRRFVEAVTASVAGGRYETEMEIVVKAIREGYRVTSAPITTIYEEGNKSSHFNKLRDSFLIYARLFRAVYGKRRP